MTNPRRPWSFRGRTETDWLLWADRVEAAGQVDAARLIRLLLSPLVTYACWGWIGPSPSRIRELVMEVDRRVPFGDLESMLTAGPRAPVVRSANGRRKAHWVVQCCNGAWARVLEDAYEQRAALAKVTA